MPEFTFPNFGRYYRFLEVVFQFLMMTMMLLFGATFLIVPNLNIFRTLAANDVHITPAGFAAACLFFALICPFMLSPRMRKVGADWKAALAIVSTAPMIFYFLIIFYLMVFIEHTFSITPLFYFSNYLLIILVPIAVFRGYHRWIEVVSTAALCAILMMFLIALIANPSMPLFNKINHDLNFGFTSVQLMILCGLSILGYLLLLFPLKRFTCRLRRVFFLAFESPIGIVTMVYFYNAATTSGAAVIPPLAFINLSFLIGLLCYALCPNGRRLFLQLTG